MKKSVIKLLPEVAEKFTVAPGARARCHWRTYSNIDLRTVSLSRAETLVQAGFPYLKPKPSTNENKGDH